MVQPPTSYLGLTLPTSNFSPFNQSSVDLRFAGTKDESLAWWRRGPPSDAMEFSELERQKELEMWDEFRRKKEDLDLVRAVFGGGVII